MPKPQRPSRRLILRSLSTPPALAILSGLPRLAIAAQSENQLDISRYAGEIVYVDFFASWCGPCQMSFPWMAAMHDKYKSQGLRIITVNLDKTRSAADRFLAKFSPPFDVVFDPTGVVAEKFKVDGMPHSFLFDRQGNKLSEHIGFLPADRDVLEQQFAKALQ